MVYSLLKGFGLQDRTDLLRFLVNKNRNLFFRSVDNTKKNVYSGNIFFIELKGKLLPTNFFFDFIASSTKNIVELANEKSALNFTYGKDIFPDQISSPQIDFIDKMFYLVVFEGNILGYSSFEKKKNRFTNKMNIGEYLREN